MVSYARRLLSINDQIVHIGDNGPRPELVIRVGTPSEYIASILPGILAQFRERWPDVRFIVRTDFYDPLVRQLRGGDIDLMIGLSMTPPHDARHSRAQEVVWVHSAATRIDRDRPVPLVSYGELCVYHRLAVQALQSVGLDWEDVFTGPSITSLSGAVERRARRHGDHPAAGANGRHAVWEDAAAAETAGSLQRHLCPRGRRPRHL